MPHNFQRSESQCSYQMLCSSQVITPTGTPALLTCPMPFPKTYVLPVTLLNQSSLDSVFCSGPHLHNSLPLQLPPRQPPVRLQVSGQQGQCPRLSVAKRQWSCLLLALELTTSVFSTPSLYPHHSNPRSHRKTDHDKWREQEHQHWFKPQLCSYRLGDFRQVN